MVCDLSVVANPVNQREKKEDVANIIGFGVDDL